MIQTVTPETTNNSPETLSRGLHPSLGLAFPIKKVMRGEIECGVFGEGSQTAIVQGEVNWTLPQKYRTL